VLASGAVDLREEQMMQLNTEEGGMGRL